MIQLAFSNLIKKEKIFPKSVDLNDLVCYHSFQASFRNQTKLILIQEKMHSTIFYGL